MVASTILPAAPRKPTFFNFDARAVRVVGTWERPLFVAKDVCSTLGIGTYRDALATLEDYMKGCRVLVDTLGGPQQVATVTEAGLYELIMRSRKPTAKLFKRWAYEEMLPSIRRTGGYGTKIIQPVRQLPPAPSIDIAVGKVLIGALDPGGVSAVVKARELSRSAVQMGEFANLVHDWTDPQQNSRLLRFIIGFQGRWLPTWESQGTWICFSARGRSRHRRYFITVRRQEEMPTIEVPI